MYSKPRSKGFTLIELMIVLALVAILAFVAVPGFQMIVESNRQTSLTNSMLGLLNYARSEALRRSETVDVVQTGTRYEANVIAGGSTTTIREMETPRGASSITRLDTVGGDLTFQASGRSNAVTPIRYLVCGASGRDGTVIRINRGGQISTEPTTVACP